MSRTSSVNRNEVERLLALSNLGIDYSTLNRGIDRLSELAAKIAGTQICLVNLIDSFSQWTISSVGIEQKEIPVENSICAGYTIKIGKNEVFEVTDLSKDVRFANQFYVTNYLALRYYLGFPLTTSHGFNVGALCVMDKLITGLSQEKKELLQMIANQVVERLQANKLLLDLNDEIKEITLTKNKLAHDIRGPITGIIGLSDAIMQQGDENDSEEIMNFNSLINASGKVVLELADNILEEYTNNNENKTNRLGQSEINLVGLKNKMEQLFAPQARLKNIKLKIFFKEGNELLAFNKKLVFQILGNLLSNSIKFTPECGHVIVKFELTTDDLQELWLAIKVRDSGVGISEEKIASILNSDASSEPGTHGEKGFGLGLNLVKILLDELDGKMEIISEINMGSQFSLKMKVS